MDVIDQRVRARALFMEANNIEPSEEAKIYADNIVELFMCACVNDNSIEKDNIVSIIRCLVDEVCDYEIDIHISNDERRTICEREADAMFAQIEQEDDAISTQRERNGNRSGTDYEA